MEAIAAGGKKRRASREEGKRAHGIAAFQAALDPESLGGSDLAAGVRAQAQERSSAVPTSTSTPLCDEIGKS